ncbi:MAG: hypothetical protein AB7U83_20600 [Vicinamibacterales bacterium]
MTSLPPAVVTAVALAVSAVEPQARPDFSGTWTMDRDRSESVHQGVAFEPPTLIVQQSASELVIETRRRQSTSRTTYQLRDTRGLADAAAQGGPRAYWDGDVLVTEAARTVQGQTVSIRERRTLDATGTAMTVQTVLVVQHGYSFRGGRNYGAATDVYRRTP